MKKIKFILGVTAALIAFYVLFMVVKNIVSHSIYQQNSEKMLSDGVAFQKTHEREMVETVEFIAEQVIRANQRSYDVKLLEKTLQTKKSFEAVPETLDSLKSRTIPIPFTNYVYVPSEVFKSLAKAVAAPPFVIDTVYSYFKEEQDKARVAAVGFASQRGAFISNEALELLLMVVQTEIERSIIRYMNHLASFTGFCNMRFAMPIMLPDKPFAASGDSVGFTFLLPEKHDLLLKGCYKMELDNPSQYDSLNVLPDNRFVFTATSDTFDRHGFAQKTVRVKAVFTDMFGDETEVSEECDYWVEKKK